MEPLKCAIKNLKESEVKQEKVFAIFSFLNAALLELHVDFMVKLLTTGCKCNGRYF